MADKVISCNDCGNDFKFSEEEQQYYLEKGFHDPKRCKPCRLARKKRDPRGGNDSRSGNREGGNVRW